MYHKTAGKIVVVVWWSGGVSNQQGKCFVWPDLVNIWLKVRGDNTMFVQTTPHHTTPHHTTQHGPTKGNLEINQTESDQPSGYNIFYFHISDSDWILIGNFFSSHKTLETCYEVQHRSERREERGGEIKKLGLIDVILTNRQCNQICRD